MARLSSQIGPQKIRRAEEREMSELGFKKRGAFIVVEGLDGGSSRLLLFSRFLRISESICINLFSFLFTVLRGTVSDFSHFQVAEVGRLYLF